MEEGEISDNDAPVTKVLKGQEKSDVALGRRKWVGCCAITDFEVGALVGEGTFGKVFKGKHLKSGKVVALKSVLPHAGQEGFPLTALRELGLLKTLRHGNVLGLLDMAYDETSEIFYMVLPFMDHDLTGLLLNEVDVRFTSAQIKCYVRQLLEGVQYLHSKNIIHRDIKTANVLINNRGELKIADFGLARPLQEGRLHYTPDVVTRWYRSPELLLGCTSYTNAIDIWGVGCIIAEMYIRRPLFPGSSDISQIEKISRLCGSLEPLANETSIFPNLHMLNFPICKRRVKEEFSHRDPLMADLLDKLLVLDPRQRLTAEKALKHPYFTTRPFPALPQSLPSYPSCHEFNINQSRNDSKVKESTNFRSISSGLVEENKIKRNAPFEDRNLDKSSTANDSKISRSDSPLQSHMSPGILTGTSSRTLDLQRSFKENPHKVSSNLSNPEDSTLSRNDQLLSREISNIPTTGYNLSLQTSRSAQDFRKPSTITKRRDRSASPLGKNLILENLKVSAVDSFKSHDSSERSQKNCLDQPIDPALRHTQSTGSLKTGRNMKSPVSYGSHIHKYSKVYEDQLRYPDRKVHESPPRVRMSANVEGNIKNKRGNNVHGDDYEHQIYPRVVEPRSERESKHHREYDYRFDGDHDGHYYGESFDFRRKIGYDHQPYREHEGSHRREHEAQINRQVRRIDAEPLSDESKLDRDHQLRNTFTHNNAAVSREKRGGSIGMDMTLRTGRHNSSMIDEPNFGTLRNSGGGIHRRYNDDPDDLKSHKVPSGRSSYGKDTHTRLDYDEIKGRDRRNRDS